MEGKGITVGIIVGLIIGAGALYFAQDYVLPIKNAAPETTVQENTVDEKYLNEYKQWATGEIEKYQDYSGQLEIYIDELATENQKLRTELDYEKQPDLEDLLEKARLESELQRYQDYSKDVEDILEDLREAVKSESAKPRTIIDDQEINWHVTDSKGNQYNWNMPIETYENQIKRFEPQDKLRLELTSTGEVFTVRDHTQFIKRSFEKVIDDVYDNAKDDANFAYEVWYIVSQLTTYSYDIGEDPRWALETLSRGGGDCEDTAILIADMLKSSKHTTNWEIQLVYFDADNPNNPKTMNHVAVSIDDGEYNYILESTSKDSPYSWPDGVTGWYFDV